MWMAGAILGKWKVSSCHIVIALPLKFFYCYNCTSLKKYLNEENYIFFFLLQIMKLPLHYADLELMCDLHKLFHRLFLNSYLKTVKT